MTYAPARLLEVRHFMKPITGLPDSALGITPDPNHDGGYHCGWDDRRIINGALADYAWQESARDWNHKTNAARAFDLGMFPRLREFSVWLVGECAAGAPDTLDIREVIYSPDGVVVRRWDRLGRRTSGDSSHRTHTHISWFADAEDRDKTAVFKRFFGDDMAIDENAFAALAWRADAEIYDLPAVRGGPMQGERNEPHFARKVLEAKVDALAAKVGAPAPVDPAVLAAVVKPLLDAMEARINARIAAVAVENRDAVADLGEGGAAKVRADQA